MDQRTLKINIKIYPSKYVGTVLTRVSRPGWLSWEVYKSGRGWLTRRRVALLYIPIFLRGGGLREILSKDKGGVHEGRLTRASTCMYTQCTVIPLYNAPCKPCKS